MTKKFPWKSLELSKFKTSDNQTLFYHFQPAECPIGNIVLTLAWNMSPDVFSPLLITNKKIKKYYNVYLFIMRGYIKNSIYNNCLIRCTIDLNEFIEHFKIKKFIIMGHSIGNALWWHYIQSYGEKNIIKFILIDESPVLLKNPRNTDIENQEYGSIIPLARLFTDYNNLTQDNLSAEKYRLNEILPQFSDMFKKENPNIMEKLIKKINYYYLTPSAQILFSHQPSNWINNLLTAKINIPTYLFGGINSVVPYTSIIYQKQYYPNSFIYIFKGESSSHFAWMENYNKFNKLINKFIFDE